MFKVNNKNTRTTSMTLNVNVHFIKIFNQFEVYSNLGYVQHHVK